jgi:hypothetical protein
MFAEAELCQHIFAPAALGDHRVAGGDLPQPERYPNGELCDGD